MANTIAFIGGSGLSKGLETALSDIKEYPNEENKYGRVSPFVTGSYGSLNVAVLSRHGDGELFRSPSDLVRTRGFEANTWKLHELGVEEVYAFSAVGSVSPRPPLVSTGSFVVPHSYARGIAASQHSFGNDAKVIFTNMGTPFSDGTRQRAGQAIEDGGYKARMRGIYVYNGGDCFETPEEIRAVRMLYGGRTNILVGMTAVPEAILCRQMGIGYAVICSNVNYAQGISEKTKVSHEQTLSEMNKSERFIVRIVENILRFYEKK